MNDQAKRWTASGPSILYGGDVQGSTWGYASDASSVATRLAACADLLRGVDDLSAVAVMTWADVEKVRAAMADALRVLKDCQKYECIDDHEDHQAIEVLEECIDRMPVPPKGDVS